MSSIFLKYKESKSVKDEIKEFISDEVFNIVNLTKDKVGNTLIKLYMDWKPESDWSMPKCQLIICFDKNLKDLDAVVKDHATYCENYKYGEVK